jgi:hypothetical protein
MCSDNVTTPFFSRPHFVQGARLLATTFCMLGVIFAGLDWRGLDMVRSTTFVWLGVGIILAATAAIGARRVLPGVVSFSSGVAIGFVFLCATWLLARTGG